VTTGPGADKFITNTGTLNVRGGTGARCMVATCGPPSPSAPRPVRLIACSGSSRQPGRTELAPGLLVHGWNSTCAILNDPSAERRHCSGPHLTTKMLMTEFVRCGISFPQPKPSCCGANSHAALPSIHSRFDLRGEQGHRPPGTAGGSGNRDFCAEGGGHRTAVRRRSILLGGPSVHPAAGMSLSLNDTA